MTLSKLGSSTSVVEVTNISSHGIWIYVEGKEYFLPYADFPWFRSARVDEILHVELVHSNHLYWPELDIDLDVDSIVDAQKYPLVYHG